MSLKVLLVGGGGREHALAWKILQSPKVSKLFVTPGNGGTGLIAENVNIQANDLEGITDFAKTNRLDLVIVAPDDPLAMGLIDSLSAAGIRAWGPTKNAAQIEASKVFAKKLMRENNIPTAAFQVFSKYDEALAYILNQGAPIVIKASGLALGKGVYVCRTKEEAETALSEIMIQKKFGESGNEVVIEEFLEGQEVSIHTFCAGQNYKIFPASQDHKTIFENDIGPNTGGMGTVAPLPWVTPELLKNIEKTVVEPALRGLGKLGINYIGCLYPGLMITQNGPKVLEFNARFGDPETQTYMRLLETDLIDIIEASLEGRLWEINIAWRPGFAVCIVLASSGYPGEYKKGFIVAGVEEAEKIPEVVVFHAGTKYSEGEIVTNGGRVLGVTATGETLEKALQKAYQACGIINFEGKHYRKDIGAKSLKNKL